MIRRVVVIVVVNYRRFSRWERNCQRVHPLGFDELLESLYLATVSFQKSPCVFIKKKKGAAMGSRLVDLFRL